MLCTRGCLGARLDHGVRDTRELSEEPYIATAVLEVSSGIAVFVAVATFVLRLAPRHLSSLPGHARIGAWRRQFERLSSHFGSSSFLRKGDDSFGKVPSQLKVSRLPEQGFAPFLLIAVLLPLLLPIIRIVLSPCMRIPHGL